MEGLIEERRPSLGLALELSAGIRAEADSQGLALAVAVAAAVGFFVVQEIVPDLFARVLFGSLYGRDEICDDRSLVHGLDSLYTLICFVLPETLPRHVFPERAGLLHHIPPQRKSGHAGDPGKFSGENS